MQLRRVFYSLSPPLSPTSHTKRARSSHRSRSSLSRSEVGLETFIPTQIVGRLDAKVSLEVGRHDT